MLDIPEGQGKILPGQLRSNSSRMMDLPTGGGERNISRLFGKDTFNVLSQGWGLYEHEWSRPEDYSRYVRDFIGKDHVGGNDSKTIAEEFAKKYSAESAKFSAQLFDLLRVESANLTEAACAHCASPVYQSDTDTVFSKLNHLEKISSAGDPDLVWKNDFSMKCGSCGAPGTHIDLSPMVRSLSASLGRNRVDYFWPFQKDESIGVDIGLESFINRALLSPFREGQGRSSQRILDKLSR